MSSIHYSPFHTLMQRMGASKPGAWFYSRFLHHLDWLSFKLSGERTTLTRVLSGLPVVVVTTTGARSGRPRTWPLLYIRRDDRPDVFGLIATNWGQRHYPAWYFNLKAHPVARCSIDGQAGPYRAHEAAGEDYDRWWRAAEATYVGYPLYKERIAGRHIPIMVMTPAAA